MAGAGDLLAKEPLYDDLRKRIFGILLAILWGGEGVIVLLPLNLCMSFTYQARSEIFVSDVPGYPGSQLPYQEFSPYYLAPI